MLRFPFQPSNKSEKKDVDSRTHFLKPKTLIIMSVGRESNNKPDSTSCDNEEVKRERMDIDSEKGGDSASQSTSSGAKDPLADSREDSVLSREGEPMDTADMGVATKSPCSSQELKAEQEGIEEDIEAEENVENTTPGHKRGRGRPPKTGSERRQRRPRARDHNAPKAPINGYVRFLNENRERCRRDNPDAAFSNITKLLAHEWSALKQEEKQKYLDAAERDRERYAKEVEQYQRTDAYKQFRRQLAEEEAAKRHSQQSDAQTAREGDQRRRQQLKANNGAAASNLLMGVARAGTAMSHTTSNNHNHGDNKFQYKMSGPVGLKPKGVMKTEEVICGSGSSMVTGNRGMSPPAPIPNIRHNPEDTTFDIPIFTEEFLDHNKAREAEMRALRKSHTELEEHNAVLAKHIDSFKDAIGRLEAEVETHRNSNKAMQMYLDKLRGTLAEAFQQV
ncbi:high mobility group protein 20A-like [Tropilaelaps mercedesae]|uniref:High mobility group protein 20A-like n=1 Tax=Tropilaelaps mercedesae TaxID=418985 RepID=A0A1V9XKC0_9ACAR|nr:high mobility group protein 20A-like [Tropilaelaps mercedesae]